RLHSVVELLLNSQRAVRNRILLDREGRRNTILIAVELIGQCHPIAGDLLVLQKNQSSGGQRDQRGYRKASRRQHKEDYAQQQEQEFVRPRQHLQSESEAEQ